MPLALFLSSFALYITTAVPVIYFEDNPMFITTAYTLGIAHPPGYPLISMVGNLAGLFPFGNFAFRCNIISGLFASASVTLFYLSAHKLTGKRLNASLFSILFALSGNLWTQAVIFEVYTLFFAFFFLLLWISLAGLLSDFRWIMFSAFLFGLGVTNHFALSVTLPGFLLLWYSSRESLRYRVNAKNLTLILAAGVFSWSIQFYTLLRSRAPSEEILFSWGRVTGFSEFAAFVTGYKTYREHNFNIAPLTERLHLFFDYLSAAIPFWGWLILMPWVLWGVYKLFLADKLRLLSFFLLFTSLLLYSTLQFAAMDIMLVIPWGIGLLMALYGVEKGPLRLRSISTPLLALLIMWFATYQYKGNDYHNEYTAYNYFSDISDTLPDDASLKLREGIQMNYTLLYGLKGPGGGVSREGSTPRTFTPYPILKERSLAPWGLLNPIEKEEGEEKHSIWNHIRSYPFKNPEESGPERLTRNLFRRILLARVALQRGYSLLEEGNMVEAETLFKRAVELNPLTVSLEASQILTLGKLQAAEKLIEALLERELSPALIRLLGRVREVKAQRLKGD